MLKKLSGLIERIATVRMLRVLMLLSALFPAVLSPAAGIGYDAPRDRYCSNAQSMYNSIPQ